MRRFFSVVDDDHVIVTVYIHSPRLIGHVVTAFREIGRFDFKVLVSVIVQKAFCMRQRELGATGLQESLLHFGLKRQRMRLYGKKDQN